MWRVSERSKDFQFWYFQTVPLEGITQIGEPLSILIFLSDKGENKFDVKAQVKQNTILSYFANYSSNRYSSSD